MIIHDLSSEKCRELLARTNIGRLACVNDLQPYVVPVSFVYSASKIYIFTTIGQKVDWMRANPLVCLQVDEIITRQDWQSVLVFGEYQELADHQSRARAHDLLARPANWWEPGYASTLVQGKTRPLEPIYFSISISKLTGRQGLPDKSK